MSITRQQLFATLGLIQVVEPLTERAYREAEQRIWELDLENSPHGQPWHTSFHASSAPGDDPSACGRKAVYSLLNIPDSEPTSRWLRSLGDAGKAIELEHVKRWSNSGILLSAFDEEHQTGYVDEEYWLTGNCDAVILPYKWHRPHVVEVKSKAEDKVNEMRAGIRRWDDKHRLQCMSYISLEHEAQTWKSVCVCEDTWKLATNIIGGVCRVHGGDACLKMIELEPCTSGSIFYTSRDTPSNTHEFYFSYDEEFMAATREKLSVWRDHFVEGTLPERPCHYDGKTVGWSEDPCRFCDLKKHVCKPDFQAKISSLAESNAIVRATDLRPMYDYEATRKLVLDRWSKK